MAMRARRRTLYFLIGLNLLMLAVGVGVALYVGHLRGEVQQSKAAAREACERGNVLRDNTRFNTVILSRLAVVVAENAMNPPIRKEFEKVVPELERRAALPRIQHQPCEALYPR